MTRLIAWLNRGLAFVGAILLVVAGLALFIVLAIAIRPLMILGAVVVVGSVALSRIRPSFCEWFEAAGESQISFSGLRLATDVATHPSHSWARTTLTGVEVGADDLVQAALGPVEIVELPPLGYRVAQGDPLFRLRRGHRSVEVRTPVSGCVVARNDALVQRPGLINEAPFAKGWALRIRAHNLHEERRRLFEGQEAQDWFRREIDRLMSTVLSREAVGAVLRDGGRVAEGLYHRIDDKTWNKLTETFFGHGTPRYVSE